MSILQANLSRETIDLIVQSLPEEEKKRIIKEYDNYEKQRERTPMAYMVPTKPQHEFLELDKIEKALYGANSAGKSFIGCYLDACYLTGKDPLGIVKYKIPEPVRYFANTRVVTQLWLGCAKQDKGIEMIHQNLIPFLPPDSYDFSESRGKLTMKATGASITAMSYGAEIEAWQSTAVDGIHLDEQCPWDKYQEARARIFRRNGRIWMTLTPLHQHSSWAYWEIYRKAKTGENPDIGFVTANLDSNTYLDDRQKKYIRNAFRDDPEAAARLEGEFVTMQGAIHNAFRPEIHIIDDFPITDYHLDHYNFMAVFDLHPRQNTVLSLIMWREFPREFYIIAEMSRLGGLSYMTIFKKAFHAKLNSIHPKLRESISDTIIDTPDPVLTAPGPGRIEQQSDLPITLRLELSRDIIGENDEIIPGIHGGPANRDLTTGISRFNDILAIVPAPATEFSPEITAPAFAIFRSCKNHPWSIENFRWDDWKNKSYDLALKERIVRKDDHEVRNIHFALLAQPAINEAREAIVSGAAAKQARYPRNY